MAMNFDRSFGERVNSFIKNVLAAFRMPTLMMVAVVFVALSIPTVYAVTVKERQVTYPNGEMTRKETRRDSEGALIIRTYRRYRRENYTDTNDALKVTLGKIVWTNSKGYEFVYTPPGIVIGEISAGLKLDIHPYVKSVDEVKNAVRNVSLLRYHQLTSQYANAAFEQAIIDAIERFNDAVDAINNTSTPKPKYREEMEEQVVHCNSAWTGGFVVPVVIIILFVFILYFVFRRFVNAFCTRWICTHRKGRRGYKTINGLSCRAAGGEVEKSDGIVRGA